MDYLTIMCSALGLFCLSVAERDRLVRWMDVVIEKIDKICDN